MKTYIHASHIHTWLTSRELFCSEPVKTKSISFYINQHTNQNISCLQNTIIVQLYFAKKKKIELQLWDVRRFFLAFTPISENVGLFCWRRLLINILLFHQTSKVCNLVSLHTCRGVSWANVQWHTSFQITFRSELTPQTVYTFNLEEWCS